MVKKRITDKELDSLYENVKKRKLDKDVEIEKPVYYDGRQYSVKIPAQVMQFIDYDKTDKIRFIITDLDKEKPTLKLEYVKK